MKNKNLYSIQHQTAKIREKVTLPFQIFILVLLITNMLTYRVSRPSTVQAPPDKLPSAFVNKHASGLQLGEHGWAADYFIITDNQGHCYFDSNPFYKLTHKRDLSNNIKVVKTKKGLEIYVPKGEEFESQEEKPDGIMVSKIHLIPAYPDPTEAELDEFINSSKSE
jgi:hypothetical protein